PQLTVPGSKSVTEGTDLAIAGIQVSDPDAGTADIRVTLSVGHCTLTVNSSVSGGLGSSTIAGNGTGTVVLTGSQDRINATLAASNGLIYRSADGYSGSDTLQVKADDLGNSGDGGAQTAQADVAVTVIARDDESPQVVIIDNGDAGFRLDGNWAWRMGEG